MKFVGAKDQIPSGVLERETFLFSSVYPETPNHSQIQYLAGESKNSAVVCHLMLVDTTRAIIVLASITQDPRHRRQHNKEVPIARHKLIQTSAALEFTGRTVTPVLGSHHSTEPIPKYRDILSQPLTGGLFLLIRDAIFLEMQCRRLTNSLHF